MNWWTLSPSDVTTKVNSDAAAGLTADEAARRLAQHGPNELPDRGIKSPWAILWEQLTGLLVIILIVAAVLSAGIGLYDLYHSGGEEGWEELYDAIAIAVIVILNCILGLTQEYRAEKAMAALRKISAPVVRVRRGGEVVEIPSRDLVPGDLVLLEPGNLVPADGRLIEAVNLRIQESALTGESEPVDKNTEALASAEVPLGDRRNMVHLGTLVTYGRGMAVVTGTGMNTALGGIAAMIQAVEREATPLQRRLEQLGKGLALAAALLVAVIFAEGLITEGTSAENLKKMFLMAISMAVAAVPEGLPAVVTIALALGAQRMLRRRALIRKLLAVETLGSVTVICSDKTGTLTENRMTVTVLDVAEERLDLTEQVDRTGPVLEGWDPLHPVLENRPGMVMLLTAGALCNDANLSAKDAHRESLHAVGDPTEGALVVAAASVGLWKADLDRQLPRVAELPFDSDRKRMTTVHRLAGQDCDTLCRALRAGGANLPSHVAFCKGAPDGLLGLCTHVWSSHGSSAMTDDRRQAIQAANARMAQSGMRVLGVAYRTPDEAHSQTVEERDMVFLGLFGMIDPPRQEVKAAIATCRTAGIRPIMITGDHPLTAAHIAGQLDLSRDGQVLTGAELDQLSVEQLREAVGHVSVYARVSPEHKLKIVQALRRRGEVVAMTGDGVNDAPALRQSDIGVAMGITGTDVSKEAADMVLQDDNFATIVAAVEEGRVIYDNIRKFIRYLLTTNSAELWVMLVSPLLGMPLPLIPLQILWMNLVTDGLPALALGVEPPERDIMRRKPRRLTDNIFGDGMAVNILWVGVVMAVVCIGLGWWLLNVHEADELHYRTMVFTVLTLSQLANVLAIRSNRVSLFTMGIASNKYLLGAVVMTIGLQMALIYTPWLANIFGTVPLSATDLLICLGLSTIIFWVVELDKLIRRRLDRAAA